VLVYVDEEWELAGEEDCVPDTWWGGWGGGEEERGGGGGGREGG